MTITADIIQRLSSLESIGMTEHGTTRLAWSIEDSEAFEWFTGQAVGLGLKVERDQAGNLWAVPDSPAPWWGVGSHLDSVRRGGRFDGALGVVAGFAVAARCSKPIAVLAFADEEGARFNTPTFGSRALVGRLDIADALGRTDDDGISLSDAMTQAGVDPDRISQAPEWLAKLRGFIELHIDQSKAVTGAGVPAGVVTGLAARTRLMVELRGQADHSGTTPRNERRDALLVAAKVIVTADALAEGGDFNFTATRILVEPNALTAVPGHVRLWLDARAPEIERVTAWREQLRSEIGVISNRAGVELKMTVQSESSATPFDPTIRESLHAASPVKLPDVISYAGHDAGILAEKIPAGMVFVRNASGISHAPEEDVDLEDAGAAAEVVLRALESLPTS